MGPISAEELRSSVDASTYVWREGLAGWLPMQDIPELQAPPPAEPPVAVPPALSESVMKARFQSTAGYSATPVMEAPVERQTQSIAVQSKLFGSMSAQVPVVDTGLPTYARASAPVSPESMVGIRPLPKAVPSKPLAEIQAELEASGRPLSIEGCVVCQRRFATDLMVKLPDIWVCGECRPRKEQEIRESSARRRDFKQNMAGFGPRAYSVFLDGIWYGVLFFFGFQIYFFTYVLVMIFTHQADIYEGELVYRDDRHPMSDYVMGIIVLSAFGLGRIVYDSIFMAFSGATIGQRSVGVRVVDSDGHFPTYELAAVRSLITSVCNLLPIVFVTALFDPQKRAPADFILGTRVVYNRQ